MKKYFLTTLTAIFVLGIQMLSAQSNFKLVEVPFVGALSENPAEDWTIGWTNFDPRNVAYPDPTDTVTLNGMLASQPVQGELNITSTLTLDGGQVYLLKGLVVVRSGGKLVIPAGTIIRATANLNSTPKNYGSIVVERGGKI